VASPASSTFYTPPNALPATAHHGGSLPFLSAGLFGQLVTGGGHHSGELPAMFNPFEQHHHQHQLQPPHSAPLASHHLLGGVRSPDLLLRSPPPLSAAATPTMSSAPMTLHCSWFDCPDAGRVFTSLADLSIHLASHVPHRRSLYPCLWHACSRGPAHPFPKRHKLIAHLRSHTMERPFTCEICGRGFAREDSRDAHLKVHADERVGPWGCACQGGRVWASWRGVRRHQAGGGCLGVAKVSAIAAASAQALAGATFHASVSSNASSNISGTSNDSSNTSGSSNVHGSVSAPVNAASPTLPSTRSSAVSIAMSTVSEPTTQQPANWCIPDESS
jgi:hypothetical protein